MNKNMTAELMPSYLLCLCF